MSFKKCYRNAIFKMYLFYLICMSRPVCLVNMHAMPVGPENGIRPLGTGVTDA